MTVLEHPAAVYVLQRVLFLALISITLAKNSPPLKINDIIPGATYNKLRPPKVDNKPAEVHLHVTIDSLDSFDEMTMSYSAVLTVTQKWTDHRLKTLPNGTTPYRNLDFDWSEYLWLPDLYFKNAKDSSIQTVTVPNNYLKYNDNKTLLYMLRTYVTLTCAMDVTVYPHDRQLCKIEMESLSYTTQDLVFVWDENRPLTVNENIILPEMQLKAVTSNTCTRVYNTGEYSCLLVELILTRNIGYFFFHTYLPLYLVIALSWISFWAPAEAALARISLGTTCLVASAALLGRCLSYTLHVLQLKAIEVFASVCTLFAFLALVEYFLVMFFLGDSYRKSSTHGFHEIAGKIDFIARIVFPVFFIIFNVIYWIVVASL